MTKVKFIFIAVLMVFLIVLTISLSCISRHERIEGIIVAVKDEDTVLIFTDELNRNGDITQNSLFSVNRPKGMKPFTKKSLLHFVSVHYEYIQTIGIGHIYADKVVVYNRVLPEDKFRILLKSIQRQIP